MSRHDEHNTSAALAPELEAIDAALRGERVGEEHDGLASLALELRAARPRPSATFVRQLDARAAGGFARRGRPARTPAGATPRPGRMAGARARLHGASGRRLLPGAAAMLAAVVVVAVVVTVSGSSAPPHATPRPAGAETSFGGVPALSPATKAAPEGSSSSRAAPTGPSQPEARQVERTAALDVGVPPASIQSTSQRVFTLVGTWGGYVRQSNVSSGEPGPGGASFDVRVPSHNLAAAIAGLSQLGHVRSETDTTNDVTDQFGSLQRSLQAARAQRAALLRQLASASESQLPALKAQLQAVERQISQLQSELGALRSRVAYSSLALSLTPEAASGGAAGGDLTPGGAAHDAARILDAALAVLVIAAAAALPLALVAIVAGMAFALLRRRLREQALDAG
jgi:hypothetical protein